MRIVTCHLQGKTHFGWILHLVLIKWGIDHKVTIISDYGACYRHIDSWNPG